MARRDLVAADGALARLVAEHPSSALVEQALYERARIAYRRGALVDADAHLTKLQAMPPRVLAEPALYLACRIAVQQARGDARACLREYRRRFPRSPHDREALALLVQLAHDGGGCANARMEVRELVRLYRDARITRAWRARCGEP